MPRDCRTFSPHQVEGTVRLLAALNPSFLSEELDELAALQPTILIAVLSQAARWSRQHYLIALDRAFNTYDATHYYSDGASPTSPSQ